VCERRCSRHLTPARRRSDADRVCGQALLGAAHPSRHLLEVAHCSVAVAGRLRCGVLRVRGLQQQLAGYYWQQELPQKRSAAALSGMAATALSSC
jgi:hypothetical protein